MNDAFQAKLQSKLADFRTWSKGRKFAGCRLVHYCGVDLAGAQSLPLIDVEKRIESLVCEGFYVDWAEHAGGLHLRVWEFGGPKPEWHRVFEEQPLVDITEQLRRIGEDAETGAAADGEGN